MKRPKKRAVLVHANPHRCGVNSVRPFNLTTFLPLRSDLGAWGSEWWAPIMGSGGSTTKALLLTAEITGEGASGMCDIAGGNADHVWEAQTELFG